MIIQQHEHQPVESIERKFEASTINIRNLFFRLAFLVFYLLKKQHANTIGYV